MQQKHPRQRVFSNLLWKGTSKMANDSIPQKRCSQCEKLLPATTEYFYKKENGLYGLYSHCRKCHYKYTSQKSIQWAKDHPERTKEISRKFVENHYEDELRRGEKYRENNRKKTRMKSRLWLQKNHLKHRIKEQRNQMPMAYLIKRILRECILNKTVSVHTVNAS